MHKNICQYVYTWCESKLFIVLSMQLQFMILISTQPKYTQIIPFREYNHCGGTTASGCLLQHACCLPQYLNVPMNNLYYSPELWRRWRTFSFSLVQQYNQTLVPTYCNTTEQYPSCVVADVAKKILRHIDSDQPKASVLNGIVHLCVARVNSCLESDCCCGM